MLLKIMSVVLVALPVSSNVYASSSHSHEHSAHNHNEQKTNIGKSGKLEKVNRIIVVEMNDNMRFSPSNINVKKGENIKFIVKNVGKIKHEIVLGNPEDLKAHADMMKRMPTMKHVEENQVSVEPGKTKEFIWNFTENGIVDFACLEPGHFEAGMKGKFVVRK